MESCLEKKEYKAIFSDIDGTLLNSRHQVMAKTKDKIQQLKKNGIPFVLVSARSPKGMIDIRDEIGSQDPMVCFSGALVVDQKLEPVYSVTLKAQEVKELWQKTKDISPETSFNIYSFDDWKVESLSDPWVKQEMDITGVQAEQVDFTSNNTFADVHKVLCMGEPEDILKLETQLVEAFPGIRIYRSKDTYLEIMSIEASKSGAVGKLASKWNITTPEILAFGDGHNDIDMLKYVGLGVAMGNADQVVKEAADYVTATNDEEGIRKVLNQVF